MEEVLSKIMGDIILGEGLFIVLVAYVLGDIIKKATPIDNRFIPAIIACISAAVAVFTPFIEGAVVVKILKGVILGWAATGGYETIRNIVASAKKEDTETESEEK